MKFATICVDLIKIRHGNFICETESEFSCPAFEVPDISDRWFDSTMSRKERNLNMNELNEV